MDPHEAERAPSRYKINWRTQGAAMIVSEAFGSFEAAKRRGRDLLAQHEGLVASVWNDDETWQVVTPAGFHEWCTSS